VFSTEFKKGLPSVSKFVSAPPHTMLKLWKNIQHWWERPGAKQDSLFATYEKAPHVQFFSKTRSVIVAIERKSQLPTRQKRARAAKSHTMDTRIGKMSNKERFVRLDMLPLV